MKLKREEYNKKMNPDGSISHEYTCKGNTFFMRIVGVGDDRMIFVYKNDQFDTDLQNVFSTKDNFLAWEEFERLVNECSDKPQSSGGFKKKPEDQSSVLPLLAIYFDGNEWQVILFLQLEQAGQSIQAKVLEFTLEKSQFSLRPNFKGVFEVDWSNFNVPDMFQCEIKMKLFDTVVYEENPSASVFLFLPNSITTQGGTPEPPDDKGEPKPDDKGEPKPDDEGEPKPDDKGEPKPDDEGEPKPDDKGEPKPDDEGEPMPIYYVEPRPEDDEPRPTPDDLLQGVADSTGIDRNVIEPFFVTIKSGEVFLLSNNLNKILTDMNLPTGQTARQLSESIFNQLQNQ